MLITHCNCDYTFVLVFCWFLFNVAKYSFNLLLKSSHYWGPIFGSPSANNKTPQFWNSIPLRSNILVLYLCFCFHSYFLKLYVLSFVSFVSFNIGASFSTLATHFNPQIYIKSKKRHYKIKYLCSFCNISCYSCSKSSDNH